MSNHNEKENALDKLYFELIGNFKQGDHITFLEHPGVKESRRAAQIVGFGDDVAYMITPHGKIPFVLIKIKFPGHTWDIHSIYTGKHVYDFQFVRAKSPSPAKSRKRRYSTGGRRRRTLRRK